MLRDRLSRQTQIVLHRQSRTQLEQRLAVSLVKFIQNGPPRRGDQSFEHIGHAE
jgi:hypothetical protein